MRVQRLLVEASKFRDAYSRALGKSPYKGQDAVRHLTRAFGQSAVQLPPSLRIELLNPRLQKFPQRKEFFAKLKTHGELLLSVLLNEHLGTRNVELPYSIIARYCELHRINDELGSEEAGIDYIYQSIGAINLFNGMDYCRSMVKDHLLEGSTGLSNLYLDALSNHEL